MNKLGVDIGGVIIDRANDDTEHSMFSDSYLEALPAEGAFETLRELSDQEFGSEVYLVSKCGPKLQARSRDWLAAHDFYNQTGVSPEHVHFTPDRIGKLAIAHSLGLTHFVDDRLEILGYLRGTVANLYLFDPQDDEVEQHQDQLDAVTVVESWNNPSASNVRAQLLGSRTPTRKHYSCRREGSGLTLARDTLC